MLTLCAILNPFTAPAVMATAYWVRLARDLQKIIQEE